MARRITNSNLPIALLGGVVYLTWLAFVYVLSAGPIVSLVSQASPESKMYTRPIEKLYAPLGWVHKHTPLRKPLEAYAQMWGYRKK